MQFIISLLIALSAAFLLTPKSAVQIEEPSFSAIEALKEHGVDVSELPLDKLYRRRESSCAAACSSLRIIYGDSLIRPENPLYDNFTDSFWSLQQADREPSCIFKAPTAASVSVTILLSRLTGCHFAARSGGHAAFEDASNIEDGITISFENLDNISLSYDRSTVAVGAGNRWHRVYSHLADYDLTVIGGRVASIGVGGLTTGGGISYLSNLYGWACDNVASYDVVLASGRQITASPTSHEDLYWALRGGGNNFGLVVSFNMYTVPLSENEMWYSNRAYVSPAFDSVAQAFHGAVVNSPNDPNAGLWVAWVKNNGTKLASTTLWYAKPNGNASTFFNDFNAIDSIAETTKNIRLTELTAEVEKSNPYGFRETYYGLTVKADLELSFLAKDIFYQELATVDDVQGGFPVLIYQGITAGQIAAMGKHGGNPLGIDDPEEPLFLIHIACWWNLESDDDRIYAFASRVLERIKEEAKARGKASRFLYMNYSSKFEDVIASYGEVNAEKLRAIARKYDPKRVFQELQPGYFKLNGPPVKDERYFSG